MEWRTVKRVVPLVAALLLSLLVAAPSSASTQVRVELPAPTGPYPVGTSDLHLIDHSRPDPWHPERRRELMVTLTYPARHAAAFPRAEWLSSPVAASVEVQLAEQLGVPPDSVAWTRTERHAHRNAPPRAGALPVMVFSPGLQAPRELYAVLIDDLASRGYLVVSMSHTYETSAVRFPGGRVAHGVAITGTPEEMKRAIDARVADTRFVLDQLARRGVDLSRVGAFGHSYGGYTAGETMVHDKRIDAGMNLDGAMSHSSRPYLPGAVVQGLDRPFLLFGAQFLDGMHDHRPGNPDQSWVDFWPNQRGYKRDLTLHTGQHLSFTDMQAALPQLGSLIDPAALAAVVGTVDPARSLAAQHAYVSAYFDLHLRGRDNHLLDGPSADFPEVAFVP